MNDLTKRDIPGLGTVTLRPLSIGVMLDAEEHSIRAESNEQATVFTSFVLSWMLEEPPLPPEDVAKLPNDVIAILVDIATDEWGLREEFESTPASLPPSERLYQACLKSLHELFKTLDFTSPRKRVNEMVQLIVSSIHEQFTQWQEAMQHMLDSLGEATARSLEEAKAASQAIGAPLTQAGFWIPPHATFGLFRLLKTLVDERRATPESLRQAIVCYYEEEGFYRLKNMVDDWRGNPYFADRMHIITDALDAHMNAKYTLSIPALLPLVEGLLTDIVGKRDRKADGSMGEWVGDAIQDNYSDFAREASKDAIIVYVTGIKAYGSVKPDYFFTPQRFPEWLRSHGLTGSQVLQRHAILHGVQIDYASKENSLRVFFILDVLSWIKRREWDRRLRARAA